MPTGLRQWRWDSSTLPSYHHDGINSPLNLSLSPPPRTSLNDSRDDLESFAGRWLWKCRNMSSPDTATLVTTKHGPHQSLAPIRTHIRLAMCPHQIRPFSMTEISRERPVQRRASRKKWDRVPLIGRLWQAGGFGFGGIGYVRATKSFFVLAHTVKGYYVAFVLIMVITALVTLYHKQIVEWLTPVTQWMHECVGSLPCPSLLSNRLQFVLGLGHSHSCSICDIIPPSLRPRNRSCPVWPRLGTLDWIRHCLRRHFHWRSWQLLVRPQTYPLFCY